jgi:hypothetical protein
LLGIATDEAYFWKADFLIFLYLDVTLDRGLSSSSDNFTSSNLRA